MKLSKKPHETQHNQNRCKFSFICLFLLKSPLTVTIRCSTLLIIMQIRNKLKGPLWRMQIKKINNYAVIVEIIKLCTYGQLKTHVSVYMSICVFADQKRQTFTIFTWNTVRHRKKISQVGSKV